MLEKIVVQGALDLWINLKTKSINVIIGIKRIYIDEATVRIICQ